MSRIKIFDESSNKWIYADDGGNAPVTSVNGETGDVVISMTAASETTLGCIKVGEGLSITSDGVLSVSYADGDEVSY